jgi:putative two-component system response regulator
MISTGDRATILLVEDDLDVCRVLTALLSEPGYDVVSANSAEQALDVLNVAAPDLILTDVRMGGMSGIDLCARVKNDPRYEFTPVVILTAVSDLDSRMAGLAAGADDFFSKPVEFAELRARVAALLRVKFLLDQLERTEAVITTLALTIEARDTYTRGHSDRLAQYAVAVGRALGVDAPTLQALQLGGYLHELGKVAVPGYPNGLKGEAIPLGARIMSCVDVYDALHTPRPYRPALPQDEAVSVLLKETNSGYWDPTIVGTFVDVLRDLKHHPVG